MPFQHSLPARKKRSQAVLNPTPRASLDGTSAVPQLRAHLDRGTRRSSSFSGVVCSFPGLSRNTFKGPGENSEEEEENSVEEEESDGTEGVPAPVGEYQVTGGPTLAQSDKPVYHKSGPPLFAIMQKITWIMANLKAY
ncbi:hypothetical protein O181_122170 [Austropuccinia psidii MF-1]|uniref:Uncharacterized protein n=1 Tax=Austropuccinia psidii MF-1 TaxID=1389203 RepID=A0A9Q3Q305_9BASI|nr:hypothetical protein [Austropuccinia psidii MF-1]